PGRPQPSVDTTRVGTLSDREREVLVLMARGLDNGQIAAELFVGEATVRTHVGHVLSKLNARSRVQAVVVAYESGLVRPSSAWRLRRLHALGAKRACRWPSI